METKTLPALEAGEYAGGLWYYEPHVYLPYRYVLGRPGARPLVCIGINPSTAQPGALDPTVKSVERLAARIDIAPGGGAWSAADGTYTYRVLAEGGTDTGDRFVLRSVTPVNVMAAGSYLLKRVCGYEGTDIEYLGAETADADKRQTNWVLDPWTLKEKDASLYAGTAADVAAKPAEHTDSDGDSYYILAYAMENTTLDNNPAFATSLRFTGTYYKAAEWNEETGGPADGATGEEKTFTYTLRHSDPDDSADASQPMLYGTVRNNIYRVKIDGVAYEGGSPQLQATINVRKWALFSHSGIVM